MAIAVSALVGWWLAVPWLTSWHPEWPTLKPVTALCLLALGLVTARDEVDSAVGQRVASVVAGFLAVSALQSFFKLNFGIDAWFAPTGVYPGPGTFSLGMAPGTAVALASVSLVIALNCRARWAGLDVILLAIAIGLGVLSAFDYLAGHNVEDRARFNRSMSLPTTVAILALSAVLARRVVMTSPRAHARPIMHLLIALGLFVLIPIMTLGTYIKVRVEDRQAFQVREQLVRVARGLSADVDRELIGEVETLRGLSLSPSFVSGDFVEVQRQLEAALAVRNRGAFILVNLTGQQLINTRVPYGTKLPMIADLTILTEVKRSRTHAVGNLFTGALSRTLQFNVAAPILIADELRYVLLRAPEAAAIQAVLQAQFLPPEWVSSIVDGDNVLIANSSADGKRGKLGEVAQTPALADQTELVGHGDINRTFFLQSSVKSSLSEWTSTVQVPKAVTDAPLAALWRAIIALAAIVGIFATVVAVMLSRTILHSFREVTLLIPKLADRRPVMPILTPVVEANDLARALVDASTARTSAEDLQLQLETLIKHSTEFVGISDARGRLTFLNGAGRALIGVPQDRAIETIKVTDYVAADAVAYYTATIMPKVRKTGFWQGEMQLRHLETGATIDVYRSIFALRDSLGETYSYATVTLDITQRKRDEQRIALLMQEVNHRAKNMLSLVQAIARQTAAGSPNDFVDRFAERVQALAANQDLLVASAWQGVDIDELVRAQLRPFKELIDTRIIISGPTLRLSASAAQTIGLALHELQTNAGKYGALSTTQGRVSIVWQFNENEFLMAWTEKNGPPVVPPKRTGFGTTVIQTMARLSLDGTVNFDYLASGVAWRLICQLSKIRDRDASVAEQL